MPVNVKHSEFSNRDLAWRINGVREASGWSPREVDVIQTLCQMAGVKGNVKWRDYRDHGSFANMLADLGGDITQEGIDRYTVLIPDNVVIAENTTVKSNLILVRIANGKFTIANGVTLSFDVGSKLITEPDVQVFDVANSSTWVGNILNSNAVDFFTPDMFGGGQTGLDLISHSVGSTANIRILKSLNITGNVSVSGDIEYIKPNVKITVAQGGTLTIGSMSSLHCHDPFVDSTGTITIGSHVRGPAVETLVTRMRSAAPDTADIPTGFAAIYVQENDGWPRIRIRNKSGTIWQVDMQQMV